MDLCKVNKLKFQEELLDKHIAALINNLNSILDFNKLNLSYKESEERRTSMKCTFKSEMTEIQNYVLRLERFKDRDPHQSPSFPYDLNSAILTLKDANISGLLNLSQLERKYTRDLDILTKKIAGFQKTVSDKSLIEKPSLKNPLPPVKNNGVTNEVREFQSFLQTSGGHTGGWADQDHRLFLKHRLKLKGSRMAEALHILLPDISPDAIAEHDEWYKQYETLRAQQSCALKNWREGSRKKSAATVIELTDKDKLKEVSMDPAVSKELAEKKRQQIQEWKLKKQELQLLTEQNIKAKKLHKIRSAAFAKEEEREKQKHIIEEYRLKKAHLKEAKLAQKSCEEASKQLTSNSKLLAMFQERDRIHVVRTMKRIQEGKQLVEECVAKLPAIVAERDPERLLRPTKAWVHHTDQRTEVDTSKKGVECNYINHLPHLKVPNWRKDL